MSTRVFVDIGDIYHKLNRYFSAKLDYELFLDYIDDEYGMADTAIAYGSQRDREATGFITCLQSIGFEVKYKRPRIFKIGEREIKRCDWGVEMSVDVISKVQACDTIILGVSNTDYIPLIKYLQSLDARVIVFASNVPAVMSKVANEVVEITEDLFENED